jgi:GNAT superfamily N-acetyltransferase
MIEYHCHYEPGAIGRIGELHGRFYADAWGTGAAFEILTLRMLIDYFEHYDPDRDLFLSAHADGRIVGSLAIDGHTTAPHEARIRAVILDPCHRGHGAGKLMLTTALDWCRAKGYQTIFLWTVDHPAQTRSRTLYERAGFREVERIRDDRYSVPLDSVKMTCSLNR